MKQLIHIILDPLLSSSLTDRLIVALTLMTIAFGFLVLAVNDIVVYILSLCLMLCIARLITELRGDDDV